MLCTVLEKYDVILSRWMAFAVQCGRDPKKKPKYISKVTNTHGTYHTLYSQLPSKDANLNYVHLPRQKMLNALIQ